MNREYIVVRYLDDGYNYEIYRIDENGNHHKFNSIAKQILYDKVLKKYSFKQKEDMDIYKDVSAIMADYHKLKDKYKRRKVNRERAKKIIPAIILVSSLAISGILVYKGISKEKKEDITTTIATSNSYETSVDLTEPASEVEFEEQISDVKVESNYFYYYFDGDNDIEAFKNTESYLATFEKYSKRYGIDVNILRAMAAQESSGKHDNYSRNGAAIGIMQIEMSIWENQEIRVFNFETNEFEIIKVGTREDLGNLDHNIKVGTAIFQNCLFDTLGRNPDMPEEEVIAFTIQKYNMGTGSMDKILKLGSNWMDNRCVISSGTQNHLEKVLRRLDDGTELEVKMPDGSVLSVVIVNTAKIPDYSFCGRVPR